MSNNRHLHKGDTLSCGLIVMDTERIMDSITQITLDDGTERVWLSPSRLEYAPNDIPIDGDGCADIADLDAILEWYDIIWFPHDAFSGEYRYKELEQEGCAKQAWLEVQFKGGRKECWAALVAESGLTHHITTNDGKDLKNLAQLRATGIVAATLHSEYHLIGF